MKEGARGSSFKTTSLFLRRERVRVRDYRSYSTIDMTGDVKIVKLSIFCYS
jgi:hypothetical protein